MSSTKFFFILIILGSSAFSKDINILTDEQIQGRLNIVNGYSSECVMHKFYSSSGWIQIEGEIGRNGIDGLYYKKKNNVISEVLVAESKWNNSRLSWSGKNALVLQMSKQWILRAILKLKKYKSIPEYERIEKLVQNDQYRARLFNLSPIGNDKIQIKIYKIKNKGMKNLESFIENTLHPIIIAEPNNSFEKGILESYDTCRTETLHKYFPILNDENIKQLLLDNYLQKTDIKALFNMMQ